MTSSLRKKEALTAWLFITPYLIGFTLFHFLPVLLSAVLSLTDMRYISMIDKTHLIANNRMPDRHGTVVKSFLREYVPDKRSDQKPIPTPPKPKHTASEKA